MWYRPVGGATKYVVLSASCDGWYSAKVSVSQGAVLEASFNVDGVIDNNGLKLYSGSGAVLAVSGGKVSSSAPSCGTLSSTMVYYKPSVVSLQAPRLWYQVNGGAARSASMSLECGGWYSASVQAPSSAKIKTAFEVNGVMDNNGVVNGVTVGYVGSGDSIAVSNGNVISDVTPGCKVAK
jgi:alpha-amylase